MVFVGGGVAAGKDDGLGRKRADELVGHIVGVNLAKHRGLAHATCDQLGDLGAEIEDQDFVMHGRTLLKSDLK